MVFHIASRCSNSWRFKRQLSRGGGETSSAELYVRVYVVGAAELVIKTQQFSF
jgi:hypothetical protein